MMTPRPIYRWKSFWLGVAVLVFMGWVAWKARDADHRLTVTGSDRGMQVVKTRGSTGLITGPLPAFIDLRENWKIRYTTVRSGRALLYGEVLGEAARKNGVRFVKVQDRVLLFCFLGLWVGWLIWQWSREQKKLE